MTLLPRPPSLRRVLVPAVVALAVVTTGCGSGDGATEVRAGGVDDPSASGLPVLPPAAERHPELYDEAGCARTSTGSDCSNRAADLDRSLAGAGESDWRVLGGFAGRRWTTDLGAGVAVLTDSITTGADASGTWVGRGLVRNDGTAPVGPVRVEATLVDATGVELGTVSTTIDVPALRPGEPAPFELVAASVAVPDGAPSAAPSSEAPSTAAPATATPSTAAPTSAAPTSTEVVSAPSAASNEPTTPAGDPAVTPPADPTAPAPADPGTAGPGPTTRPEAPATPTPADPTGEAPSAPASSVADVPSPPPPDETDATDATDDPDQAVETDEAVELDAAPPARAVRADEVAEVRWRVEAAEPVPVGRDLELGVLWTRPADDPRPVDLYLYADPPTGAPAHVVFGAATNVGGRALEAVTVVGAWVDGSGRVLEVAPARVVRPEGGPVEGPLPSARLDPGEAGDLLLVVDPAERTDGAAPLRDAELMLWGWGG